MKYKIVQGFIDPQFAIEPNIEDVIQDSLDAGFKLIGNLFHVKHGLFAQAMIYYQDDEQEENY